MHKSSSRKNGIAIKSHKVAQNIPSKPYVTTQNCMTKKDSAKYCIDDVFKMRISGDKYTSCLRENGSAGYK